MDSHIISESSPLSPAMLQQIANSGHLDEISNAFGSVRRHIFWHGDRDKTTSKLRQSMLFFIYQTSRHGPQNGFRLCLVHPGYHIASDTKAEDVGEDEVDYLEKEIPQGYMEFVTLGEAPVAHSENIEENE